MQHSQGSQEGRHGPGGSAEPPPLEEAPASPPTTQYPGRPAPRLADVQQQQQHRTLSQRLARRMEIAVVIWSCVSQARLYAISAAAHSPQALLPTLGLACVRLGYLAFSLCTPHKTWWRLRPFVMTFTRLAIAMQLRWLPTEGDLGVFLNRRAAPGVLGAVGDWGRAAYGARMLMQAVTAAAMMMPPGILLFQQLLVLALSAPPDAVCATTLMSDPLTQRRLRSLWALLDTTPLPFGTAGLGPAPAGEAGERDVLVCATIVRWHQIVIGLLMPLLASGCTAAQLEAESEGQLGGRRGRRSGALGAAAAAARAAWSWLDGLLVSACEAMTTDALYMGLAAWLICGTAWLLAKAPALAAASRPGAG